MNKRKAIFWTGLIFVFLILGTFASRIRFEEDIAKLLPKGPETEQLTKILETIEFSDKTVIIVESDGQSSREPEIQIQSLKNYAAVLIEGLQQQGSNYIESIQGTADNDQFFTLLDVVERNLPLFLDSLDYADLAESLKPEGLRNVVEAHAENLQDQAGIAVNPISFRQDPFDLILKGLKKFQSLQGASNVILDDGYILSEEKNHLFIFVNPLLTSTETDQNEKFIELLQGKIDSLNSAFKSKNVSGEFFGSTAMSVANAKQIKSDIQTTLGVALLVLIALFIYFYRKIHIPFVILMPVLFGSLLGLVVLFWIKGTVSAVSIGIGSVLLGITLDYSLHILSHYRSTGDVAQLYRSTTKALMICAVFTALDFLCLIFLRSEVLQDLGLFAAVSVLGAAVFALIFIPQVYKPGSGLASRNNTWIDKLANVEYHKKKWLLGFCLLLVVISIFTYTKVGFDNDLQNLNYQPKDLAQALEKFEALTQTDGKSMYVVGHGHDLDEVLGKNQEILDSLTAIQDRGQITQFSTVAFVLPGEKEQQQRLEFWNSFWAQQDLDELKRRMQTEGAAWGFRANTYQPFWDVLDREYEVDNEYFKSDIFSEWIGVKDGLYTVLNTVRLPHGNADQISKLFQTREGILLLDRKQIQEAFLHNLEIDFNNLLWITSIVMFVVIFLFFGNLELTLITNIPVMLGWFVTLGMMGLLKVDFNAFNIIIATLVFGLGIDYAIFVTRALLDRFTYGQQDLSAYRTGILMSAMATLLCFGILVFAKHPAIHSIALIPLIGLTVVVLMSFTIQPFLFEFYIQKPQDKGNTPRTIWNILWTVYTFGYFFVGGFLLSVFSQIYMAVWPSPVKKKFAFFHASMQKFFRTLMYSTPNCRIRIQGARSENFAKPVILIANHTSQLDTPTVGMLHDKMIFVVNERVLNSKFFGRSLRMAGFYSTDDQNQAVLDGCDSPKIMALKKKIAQGYSIIIFAEGTRSRTAEIGRFHKGAFLLAEQLGIDILPVMVHGVTDLLPKNDNILKPGNLTISFLPLIRMDDLTWGTNYRNRTRSISKHFKDSFRKLRREIEGPDYFWTKLKFNFTYKPRSIRQEVYKTFHSRKDSYHALVAALPEQTRILHVNSHWGVLDYLLAYDAAGRNIVSWGAEENIRKVCSNTYSVNRYALQFPVEPEQFIHKAISMDPEVLILTGNSTAFEQFSKILTDLNFLAGLKTIVLESGFGQQGEEVFADPEFLSRFVCTQEEHFIKIYQKRP